MVGKREREEITIEEGKIENKISIEEKMIGKGVQIEDMTETGGIREIKDKMMTKDQPESSDKVKIFILRST